MSGLDRLNASGDLALSLTKQRYTCILDALCTELWVVFVFAKGFYAELEPGVFAMTRRLRSWHLSRGSYLSVQFSHTAAMMHQV